MIFDRGPSRIKNIMYVIGKEEQTPRRQYVSGQGKAGDVVKILLDVSSLLQDSEMEKIAEQIKE